MSHTVNLDEYLSAIFRPEIVANKLIRETTTAQDTTVDTKSALTRILYDIDEIDHRMETLCQNNTDALLAHARRSSQISKEVELLRPTIEDLNSTVNKLDRDFVDPFNRATDLHSAGENLYRTALLARTVNWYLQLALQAQSEDYKRDSSDGSAAAMLRNAYAIKTQARLMAETPDLARVNAVIQFEKRIPAIRASLIDAASNLIKTFNGIGPSQVKLAAMALLALNADLDQIMDSHMRVLVGSTVQQLTKTGGVAIEQEQAFADAHDRAEIASTLLAVQAELMSKAGKTHERTPFWSAVALQLDQKLRTMSVANQRAMQKMKDARETILSSAKDVAEVHAVFVKYI